MLALTKILGYRRTRSKWLIRGALEQYSGNLAWGRPTVMSKQDCWTIYLNREQKKNLTLFGHKIPIDALEQYMRRRFGAQVHSLSDGSVIFYFVKEVRS